MDLIPQLLANIGGGIGAAMIDRKWADKQVTLGPVTLTAGAVTALAAVALTASGVKFPGRHIVAGMAGGALIYEGTKVGEQSVVPLLEKYFPMLGAPPAAVPVAGQDYVSGFLSTGLPDRASGEDDDYELQRSLSAWRSGFAY